MPTHTQALDWSVVFNSSLRAPMWGNIETAMAAARAAGYEWFTWNGWVYPTDAQTLGEHVMLEEELGFSSPPDSGEEGLDVWAR